MIVRVCIGSACHLKGSYEVIKKLKGLIESKELMEQVELKSSFCLGQCSEAVSVKLDDQDIHSVNSENVVQFFEKEIIGGL